MQLYQFKRLTQFLKNVKPLININDLAKKANAGQGLKRMLLGLQERTDNGDNVIKELVKLHGSLDKFLKDEGYIKPEGLFK